MLPTTPEQKRDRLQRLEWMLGEMLVRTGVHEGHIEQNAYDNVLLMDNLAH
jgi:hypothetical protein